MSDRGSWLMSAFGFQVGWFACVLGAARGVPWLGPAIVGCLALGALATSQVPKGLCVLWLLAGTLGYAMDSALVLGGTLDFGGKELVTSPSPLWMVALWVNFAATLDGCLAWLRGRYLLGSVLGVLGGPAAYVAGERLGAVRVAGPWWPGIGAIGVLWGISVPLLLAAERWLLGPRTSR